MQGWELVVLGAAIALVSGSVTEVVRSELTRWREKRDHRDELQRESLLAILDHLTLASVAAADVRYELAAKGYPENWDSERAVEFSEHMDQVRKHAALVTDARTQELALAAIKAHGRLMLVRNNEEAKQRDDDAQVMHEEALRKIGERIRSL